MGCAAGRGRADGTERVTPCLPGRSEHKKNRRVSAGFLAERNCVTSTAVWRDDAVAIDRARIQRGWTRRDLGRQARVDEGTLCDLFAGRRRPTFGTLRSLCTALDLSLQSVISFEGSESQFTLHNGGRQMLSRTTQAKG